jgi:hypothetical protein
MCNYYKENGEAPFCTGECEGCMWHEHDRKRILKVSGKLYLEMLDGETLEEARARLFDELDKTDISDCFFDSEEIIDY